MREHFEKIIEHGGFLVGTAKEWVINLDVERITNDIRDFVAGGRFDMSTIIDLMSEASPYALIAGAIAAGVVVYFTNIYIKVAIFIAAIIALLSY